MGGGTKEESLAIGDKSLKSEKNDGRKPIITHCESNRVGLLWWARAVSDLCRAQSGLPIERIIH